MLQFCNYIFTLFIALVSSEKNLGSYAEPTGQNTVLTPNVTSKRYKVVHATGNCEEFSYKGKGLDFNNFKSLEECENHKKRSKDDVYKAIKAVSVNGQTNPSQAPGSLCDGVGINKYYLKKNVASVDGTSTTTFSCETFEYKGCGGGQNFFDSKIECLDAIAALVDGVKNRFSCGIHPDLEDNRHNVIMVIADMTNRKCVHAIVNEGVTMGVFDSVQQCTNICLSGTSDMNPKCNSKISQMRCDRRTIQRYFYNKASKVCEIFETEDCIHPENGNIFETFDDCVGSCPTHSVLTSAEDEGIVYKKAKDICRFGRSEGMGHLFLARYYYDRHTSTCLPFIYRGIGGNDNRFMTMDECMGICSGDNIEISKPPSVKDPVIHGGSSTTNEVTSSEATTSSTETSNSETVTSNTEETQSGSQVQDGHTQQTGGQSGGAE